MGYKFKHIHFLIAQTPLENKALIHEIETYSFETELKSQGLTVNQFQLCITAIDTFLKTKMIYLTYINYYKYIKKTNLLSIARIMINNKETSALVTYQ